MTIAIGYIRVSTAKQADSGLSLEAQRASIARWCEDAGVTLAGVHEDAGVSGSTPTGERKGLMSALTQAATTGASHLVVSKLDRLSRSPFILLTLEKSTKRSGLRITSAAGEGTADDDPSSILVRRMLQAVAEHELQMIRARTRAGMAMKKARGERVGRPPYGFTMLDGVLVPGDAFESVRLCLSLYYQHELHSWGGFKFRRVGGSLRPGMRMVHARMVGFYPDDNWTLNRVHAVTNRWKSPTELEKWNEHEQRERRRERIACL